MNTRTTPPVIAIVGPSGAGKDTVVQKLLERKPDAFHKFVSTTTRSPRPGEVDGVDYHFRSPEVFEEWKQAGKFISTAHFAGTDYGTLRSEFEGDKPILAIVVEDVAESFREWFGARIVAITVPEDTVRERMLARGDDPEAVNKRLAADAPRREVMSDTADHIIVNDDLDEAVNELDSAISFEIRKRSLPQSNIEF